MKGNPKDIPPFQREIQGFSSFPGSLSTPCMFDINENININ